MFGKLILLLKMEKRISCSNPSDYLEKLARYIKSNTTKNNDGNPEIKINVHETKGEFRE